MAAAGLDEGGPVVGDAGGEPAAVVPGPGGAVDPPPVAQASVGGPDDHLEVARLAVVALDERRGRTDGRVARPEEAAVAPGPAGLLVVPVAQPAAGGHVQGLHVAVVGGAGEGGLPGGVGGEGARAGPGERGVALAPPVLEAPAGGGGEQLEVAVGAAVAALVDVAGVQAALGPRVDVGAAQAALGPIVDVDLAVGDPAVAADVVARPPGVLEQPAAGRVVVADDQHAVAAREMVARTVVHAGAEAEEVVVDVEAGGQRADRVQPDLLLLHVAEPDVVGDPDGPAGPVPAGRVLGAPGVAAGGRQTGGRRAVRPAVRVGEPPVRLDPIEGGLRIAALAAGEAQAVVDVPLGALRPHVVLDPGHGLHQSGGAEGPAGTARVLVLHLGDPRPSPAAAPVHGGGPGRGRRPLDPGQQPVGGATPGQMRIAARVADDPREIDHPCVLGSGQIGPGLQTERGPRHGLLVGEVFQDRPARPLRDELRTQLPHRLDRFLRHGGPPAATVRIQDPGASPRRPGASRGSARSRGGTRGRAVARGRRSLPAGAAGAGRARRDRQPSSEIAFLARSTDSSDAGPPGFSVASAWLRSTKGRIRSS